MKIHFVVRRVLLPFLGLIGVFVVLVLLINLSLFDERLNPEIINISVDEVKEIPPKYENAYIALLGISAASDKDPVEVGTNLISRYLSNRDEKNIDKLSDKDYSDILGGQELDQEWLAALSNCNSGAKNSCLNDLTTKLNLIPELSNHLVVMIERYREIVKLQQYQRINDTTLSTPLPRYVTVLQLSQTNLALLNTADTQAEFIEQLDIDLKFWRMILEQGSSLLEKLIAVFAIRSDLNFLSDFIQSKTLSLENQILINALLLPLTKTELDISESFTIEALHMYQTLNTMKSHELENIFGFSSKILKILIQPNATKNMHYQEFLKPAIKLGKLDKHQLYELVINDKIDLNKAFKVSISPTSLYNLGGKLLLPASIWSASDYIARVHDLNAMIDLVKLQLSLKDIPLEDFQLSINNSAIKNPYTNAPLNFDKQNLSLGFDCLNKHSICHIKL